ncbi:4-hydroxy-tetrahydrodipicolinate synthase [Candidatus Bathyarchaeota archaeon CG_4_8_14_3_um_filter_42_8]|nr:MAG: 4-hydroxy-tetrahydrodipicolinate synthase [Candidatus Bathyarchaeota archaeon CG_4_8_14_3_um_filter_42_8]
MPRLVLNGIFVPHVTPFTREGELDLKALRACARFWLESVVSGLVPCGSNGEAPYLSRQERIKVIETVVDEVNGKIPVVAGTGSMSTKETITFTKDAKDLGADAALIVTPFYFKPTNREMQEHYRTISEAVDLPIVVYNVPKFTGFSLETAFIHQLVSENEKIIGLKDSSGNIGAITEIIRLVGDKISVLAGTADVALPTFLLEGKGAIIAVANVFPKLCSQLYETFKNGKYEEAKTLQKRISFANEVLVKRYNQLSAIKEALRLQGLPGGYPRKPALPLDSEEKKAVQNLLKIINEPL